MKIQSWFDFFRFLTYGIEMETIQFARKSKGKQAAIMWTMAVILPLMQIAIVCAEIWAVIVCASWLLSVK